MVNVQKQFDRAVAIVKELPPDGPVKPSQDQQLDVRFSLAPYVPWFSRLMDSFTPTSNKPTRGTTLVLLQVCLSLSQKVMAS